MTEGLTLTNVCVDHGRTRTIDCCSLTLAPGQIVAVVGPNGAGKSTLLGAIAGSVAHSGTILWESGPIDCRTVGFMPQHCSVNADLSVLQTVLLARHEQLGWRIGEPEITRALTMLCELGLEHLANRRINTLSGGQQQLVLLGQRLMRQPRLLILDEATCALDLRHQLTVLALLRDYVCRSGALILMAVHDLNLAARTTDRLLLLHKGRVAASGEPAAVLTASRLGSVYGVDVEVVAAGQDVPFVIPIAVRRSHAA